MTQNYLPLDQLCIHYEIEMSFFYNLLELDLIEIETIEQVMYLPEDRIGDLEKIIRLNQELHINFEGIDTVLHLLHKIEELQTELTVTKNRLRLYEDEKTEF